MRNARRRPQAPAMGVDDRAANGKPHAETVGLGRHEWLEDPLRDGLIHSRSTVLHGDEHAAWLNERRRDRELVLAAAYVSHGFDTVQDQVQQHLLQLYSVPNHRPI